MFGTWIASRLDGLGAFLIHADVGLVLVFLVGLSFSGSHLFALLANRLTPRQILLQFFLDGLVLALAFLSAVMIDMVLLATLATLPIRPTQFVNGMGASLLPGLFYGLAAAPYISDLIAGTIWFLIHLNVVTLLHARFQLPYGEGLLLTTPGLVVAMVLVALLFRSSWQASYRRLAADLASAP